MPLPSILENRLRLPVIASPMFIASGPELVIAQCNSGIVGSFPSLNARPSSMLDEWLHQVEEQTEGGAPFAVNLIVHRTNSRLEEDLSTVVARRAPIVITSLGAQPEVNEAVHSYGGIVLHDVIHDRFARKAIEKGADGLIAVAAGAGGHAGAQSPFALLQEIRAWFDGPLVLSGAIAHGRSVLAALAAGADLAYIGSAFLSTHEANTSEEYKRDVVGGSAQDIVYSNFFTGVHGNYLRSSIIAAGYDPDNLPSADPSSMDFGRPDAKAWKEIWGSGQGIGAIDRSMSVAEFVDQLCAQFDEAKARLNSQLLS